MFNYQFNSFSVGMGLQCVCDCSAAGAVDEQVSFWARNLIRPSEATPEAIKKELKEYGAWDEIELQDDEKNWERIVWIAACNMKEQCPELN